MIIDTLKGESLQEKLYPMQKPYVITDRTGTVIDQSPVRPYEKMLPPPEVKTDNEKNQPSKTSEEIQPGVSGAGGFVWGFISTFVLIAVIIASVIYFKRGL